MSTLFVLELKMSSPNLLLLNLKLEPVTKMLLDPPLWRGGKLTRSHKPPNTGRRRSTWHHVESVSKSFMFFSAEWERTGGGNTCSCQRESGDCWGENNDSCNLQVAGTSAGDHLPRRPGGTSRYSPL